MEGNCDFNGAFKPCLSTGMIPGMNTGMSGKGRHPRRVNPRPLSDTSPDPLLAPPTNPSLEEQQQQPPLPLP